jgi:DNA-binding MarR family transcriptional regulator
METSLKNNLTQQNLIEYLGNVVEATISELKLLFNVDYQDLNQIIKKLKEERIVSTYFSEEDETTIILTRLGQKMLNTDNLILDEKGQIVNNNFSIEEDEEIDLLDDGEDTYNDEEESIQQLIIKKINLSIKKGNLVKCKDGFEGIITKYSSNKSIEITKNDAFQTFSIYCKDDIIEILK